MRRATVGPGAKDSPLFPSARAPSGNSSRGRNGGLFSSSSSSSGDSDASDEENDGNQRAGAMPPMLGAMARSRSANTQSNSISGGDFRRRTMFSASTTSMSSSANSGDNGGHSTERKGLFENDDDAGDSLETFHKRVKLRQSQKQSEMKALKAQLETAQQRAEDLETRLSEANKDKEECAIRTKECQRIIEKRNKQLMKASEKMARHSEQYELQMTEIQTRLAAMTAQSDQLRADAATTEEINRRERELKKQESHREIETQNKKHDRLLQAAEARLREQQAENAALVEKLREVQQQLTTTAHQKPTAAQVMASDKYQSLMKRCEDAEAISRGLNFQLEKEQQEKKYLRKQLTALQDTVGVKTAAATAASVGFFPDAMMSESRDDAGNPRDSIATVVAEAELASFDFTAGKESTPSSPIAAETPPPPGVSTPTSAASSPSRSQNRSRGFSASSFAGDSPKPREVKRRAASAQTIKTTIDPLEKPAEDKTTAANGKSIGTSVTFFEKLSSRFKRASSPRNGLNGAKAEDDGADAAPTGEAGFDSPLAPRQGFAHSKVLKERPRMYVARSPSHHEDESSDSIFGSESSSSDSSDEDMPPPPPPPPISVHEAPPPFKPPVHVDISSQLIPPDAGADADLSSVSESEDDDDERHESHEASDKPTQLPTRFADPFEAREQIGTSGVSQRISSSSSSFSSSSDDDADEPDVEKSQPLNVDTKKVDSLSESSSSSDSSSADEDDHVVRVKTEVHRKVRKSSLSGQDRHDKRSSRSPTSSKSREKKRSLSGGDNTHSTSKSRMNEYMEARAKKRNEKLKRKQEKEHEETKKKEEYEKEWEKMAQEERERKRKQQQARRNGRRRPASMKAVRVSQMRQQMNSKQQQKDQKEPQVSSPPHPNDPPRPHGDDSVEVDGQPRRNPRRKSESKTSESEAEEERSPVLRTPSTETPPLPPEPTLADTELYLRQQARLRERHELQMKKKLEADEADAVRGDIHRRVEMWAFGKELLHMILTLDQISSNDALKKCQLMVVQSPDDNTVRKAYRNIIRVVHPDKLRGATVPEQLEAKELFTVLNQAFEKFKNQTT
ncbi:hypothetical protein PC129_g12682 [Phytophthora cactorum]|uniref:J domain-containing protein n=1 Tax=Phytophthora cactorum TaxID=29920 RepID=A0A329RS81_9STRA|nr:hypothetical protein PC111_g14490 [Phytophthora cactorum]KAG2814302.1 hypothetical protein PC112_g14373 [Phytophthora cactorum]KAG2866556.1 hypothetical protein PC113_g2726 [Phytophthora cactorum]KAG2895042.1 hypothetical protein PC114_g15645 [Phytophthora cactorum]KAG2904823.1 hypothetical protein PC115_g14826 [Phytophthora cactorum]